LTFGAIRYTFTQAQGGHSSTVATLLSLGNNLLASGSHDSTIKIWDVASGRLKKNFDSNHGGHFREVVSLVLMGNLYL
jgi:WD40 repeat protein